MEERELLKDENVCTDYTHGRFCDLIDAKKKQWIVAGKSDHHHNGHLPPSNHRRKRHTTVEYTLCLGRLDKTLLCRPSTIEKEDRGNTFILLEHQEEEEGHHQVEGGHKAEGEGNGGIGLWFVTCNQIILLARKKS